MDLYGRMLLVVSSMNRRNLFTRRKLLMTIEGNGAGIGALHVNEGFL